MRANFPRILGEGLPSRDQAFVPVLLALIVLIVSAGSARAQGPGLYKDGRKVLDLVEAVADLPATDKAMDGRMNPGQALYQQIMGSPSSRSARPFEVYFDLAGRCREIIPGLAPGNDGSEAAIQALLELEPALVSAHAGVVAHLAGLRDSLLTLPDQSEKLERVNRLEQEHLPRVELLLSYLATLREARSTDNIFAEDGARRDLELYFADVPDKAPASPVNDGFRPVPMTSLEPTMQVDDRNVKAARAAYPPRTEAYLTTDPDDLAETIDVQLTPEIVALADSLGRSPVAIYYFVRDQFAFEPYLGSRKGSAQTLVHRAGNDYDQASLLIALMRASGIPARYASGRAYMPIERALNWLGFSDKRQAGSLLATAGMQGTLHITGADTVGLSCKRVWVEAYMPFANYRGAINDSTGFMWVPLDPAFKQHEIQWGHNLPADMGFDAESFVDDYITTFRSETPAQKFVQDLGAEMATYYPGATLQDLVDRRSVILEPDGILPGTLPYELLAFDGTYSSLSASQRYGIRFHLYAAGMDLDYATSLPQIVLKQVTISYVGATPADQAIIDAAGGVFQVADPYLVDVVPVLKIDGCEVARGSGYVMMGRTHNSDMHFTAPTGAGNQIPMISNVIQAGNSQGIGIDTGAAYPAFFGTVSTTCAEDLLGQELHQTALTYLNNVDTAEDQIADYLHTVLLNDVSEAIVENAVTVMYSGSYPVTFTWNGMIVDADRKIIGPFATDGRLAPCQHMRLAGADGSFQENRVFELRYAEEAISTIKILGLAADSLITVCRITSSLADCPGLNQPPAVLAAINAALSQGHEVIIPQRQLTYFEWTGTAWIDIDPVTCAAGYIISGGNNGGATVQIWWQDLIDMLTSGSLCVETIGEVAASPSPDHGDNIYFADNTGTWKFTIPEYRGWGVAWAWPPTCRQTMNIVNKEYTVKYSIKELADSPWFGPGEYTFRVGGGLDLFGCGCNSVEKKVIIFRSDLEVPDLAEDDETAKGRIILVNNDFDEGNKGAGGAQRADNLNDNVAGDRIVAGDAELLKATLKLEGGGLTGKWRVTFPSTVKVWHDDGTGTFTKLTSNTLSTSNVSLPKDIDLWIEGVSLSSSLRDVSVKGGFIPSGESAVLDKEDEVKLTVAQVEIEPVCLLHPTFPLYNPSGIATSQTGTFEMVAMPAAIPDSDIKWTVRSGSASFSGGDTGRRVTVLGTGEDDASLDVEIANFVNSKPTIDFKVVDQKSVDLHPYLIVDDAGTGSLWTPAAITACMPGLQSIYRQAGITFDVKPIQTIKKTDWLVVNDTPEMYVVSDHTSGTSGFELYFVNEISGTTVGVSVPGRGIIFEWGSTDATVAHELGHGFGLKDIYEYDHLTTIFPEGPTKQAWVPDDWNGGESPLYYSPTLQHRILISRLLMYGYTTGTKNADLPLGRIYGYRNYYDSAGTKTRSLTNVEVGWDDLDRDKKHD